MAATDEIVGEVEWQRFRLIVAHRPDIASEQVQARDERIAALEEDAAQWAGKLDGQETRKTYRGRKLSDAGTTASFYRAVAEAHLANINDGRQADPGLEHAGSHACRDRGALQGAGKH